MRRETYVGEWLPEPLVTSEEDDPARHAEMADSLSLAFLVLLESLSPEQRAVFLLREVFDYPYDQIAEIVGKSEDERAPARGAGAPPRRGAPAALRGLARAARRARASASSRPPRRATSRALEALLAEDVELHGDGGGKAPGARARAARPRPRGAHAASPGSRRARASAASRRAASRSTASPARSCLDAEGRVISVMALDIADGQIQAISSIVNPDKLHHLGPVADVGALLRGRKGH